MSILQEILTWTQSLPAWQSDAVARLLSDPDLAARLGTAGRAHARQQTWDAVAAQMIGVYQSV